MPLVDPHMKLGDNPKAMLGKRRYHLEVLEDGVSRWFVEGTDFPLGCRSKIKSAARTHARRFSQKIGRKIVTQFARHSQDSRFLGIQFVEADPGKPGKFPSHGVKSG